MYEDARRDYPRPGDIWWLPSAWWPTRNVWLIRPDRTPGASPTARVAAPHDQVDNAWSRDEEEQIYLTGKLRPCVILSPSLDLKNSQVPRFIALHTYGYKEKIDEERARAIRERVVPHAYPLPASVHYGLEERWVDFTSMDCLPRAYLRDRRWEPICGLKPDAFERLLKHYGRWLTRDQAGKT